MLELTLINGFVMELKMKEEESASMLKYPNAKYFDGARPWEVKCDIALPCATQNELNEDEKKHL
jgi:glutamate dehydrogenase (NADP+)